MKPYYIWPREVLSSVPQFHITANPRHALRPLLLFFILL